ncbi:MAG: translation initiation factor IF-2 [Chitinophagales bacterium]
MSDYKPMRLIAAAKKFNVGASTITEFLQGKGFDIDNRPTTKLSEEMYQALRTEYSSDVDMKKEAEQVQLGSENKGVSINKEEETETFIERPKVELSGPKVIGKIDVTPKEAEDAKPADSSSPSTTEEESATKKPSKAPAKEVETIQRKKVELSGPKVLGKIEIKPEPQRAKKTDDASPEKRQRKRFKKASKVGPVKGTNPGRAKTKDEPTVVSEKEIEEKIKNTMAKLQAASSGKSQRAKLRRQKRQEIQQNAELEAQRIEEENSTVLKVTEFVTVSELASMLNTSPTDIITKCFGLGVMVSINQRLDAEIIELVASEFERSIEFISASDQDVFEDTEDAEEDRHERAPIVTIMGHVDHGKTSLLDYIREANVVSGEAGGITQHIGAYEVNLEQGNITFLDTPGHEAFTAMRARGAKLTDIAVIVIAADDDIMPQTKEAISHAQSAGVPMIFAINKIDKENADANKIKEKLSGMNILVEEWGGKHQSQDLSAMTGLNVDQLLEKILLESELLELKANAKKPAIGTVIEASLDRGRGYVATVLVQNGSLNIGDFIVAGGFSGKVKAMFDHRSQAKKTAGPAVPVQILGLDGAPAAGERFKVFATEQEGKQVATKRAQLDREQGMRTQKHITLDEIGRRLALGTFKELNVIVKGDVDGSTEALSDSLLKLSTEEIQVNILHKAVGGISESDVMLASASDAIIVGFQVRPSASARRLAETEGVELRMYSIIYNAIEEIKAAMEGLLEPTVEEKILGNLEIKEVFKISRVGTVAGCMVTDGKIYRNAKVRIVREGIVVYTGELESLKRFKDDVKEVVNGQDCGLNIKGYNDIKVGDVIEAYEEISIQRTL